MPCGIHAFTNFVESRDLFFEKLSVVRTRADQAHSKGSWWSPARRASGYGSKELVLLGSEEENVIDILSSECVYEGRRGPVDTWFEVLV